MIERINAHVQGQVGNDNVYQIKDYIVDQIEHQYEKIFSADCNPKKASDSSAFAAYLMFGQEHYISVNSKNIEFLDSFHYEGFRPQSEFMLKQIKQGWVKDFLIRFWIYRLGQYSYFAAEINPLLDSSFFDIEKQ